MLKEECEFLVKQENDDDGEIVCSRELFKPVRPTSCLSCDEKQATINMLQTEKMRLITMVSTQKEENQHVTNELEEAKQKLATYSSEKVDLQGIISTLKSNKHRLTTEFKEVNEKCSYILDENMKLKLEVEQFNLRADNQYEVEKLISHKKSKSQQCFLVRWKGFSSDHDSWVPQKDLMCPEILETYKKGHNLI